MRTLMSKNWSQIIMEIKSKEKVTNLIKDEKNSKFKVLMKVWVKIESERSHLEIDAKKNQKQIVSASEVFHSKKQFQIEK